MAGARALDSVADCRELDIRSVAAANDTGAGSVYTKHRRREWFGVAGPGRGALAEGPTYGGFSDEAADDAGAHDVRRARLRARATRGTSDRAAADQGRVREQQCPEDR